ncbi:MAG: nuclear transport factor 2 family protein [Bacteroidota bacterium]
MEALTVKSTGLEDRINDLNKMILQGKILEAFVKFYAPNVIMQENENEPTIGKAACRINEEAFVNNITEFRGASVKNVIVSDNITTVEWEFDFTHAEWGERNYTQVAVQRWNDEGQIVNEKFYYNS